MYLYIYLYTYVFYLKMYIYICFLLQAITTVLAMNTTHPLLCSPDLNWKNPANHEESLVSGAVKVVFQQRSHSAPSGSARRGRGRERRSKRWVFVSASCSLWAQWGRCAAGCFKTAGANEAPIKMCQIAGTPSHLAVETQRSECLRMHKMRIFP